MSRNNETMAMFMQFSKKRGAKPKFATSFELAEACQKYFDEYKVPIITGLALYLGFSGRKGLNDMCKKQDEIGYTARAAKTAIEAFNEKQLYNKGVPTRGVIFNLNVNHSRKPSSRLETEDLTPPEPLSDKENLILDMMYEGAKREKEKLQNSKESGSTPPEVK